MLTIKIQKTFGMALVFLISFFQIQTLSFASSDQEVAEFLEGLDGDYSLVTENSAPHCPILMKVTTAKRFLEITNLQGPADPQNHPGDSLAFHRIGLRRRRTGDDMFTYIDRIDRLNKGTLTHEYRNCGGILFIRCSPWVVEYAFKKNNPNIEVTYNPRLFTGSCVYSPNL